MIADISDSGHGISWAWMAIMKKSLSLKCQDDLNLGITTNLSWELEKTLLI
jgi:hypothetical protein